MQFERLVLESGDNSIAFDLHPRLTVIAGLSQMERDGLINEFVGALGNSRSGVHLELVAGNGHRFAVSYSTWAILIVIPRSRSSGALSMSANSVNAVESESFDNTRVIAAVNVVFPWSM